MKFLQQLFALIIVAFLCVACEDQGHKITLYTSLPERDLQELIQLFNQHHPHIKVSFFRSDTTVLVSKIDTEFMADNPKADILLISDDIVMTRFRDTDRLSVLSEVDVSHYPQESYDPKRTSFGTVLLGTGLVCHQEFTPPSTSLKSLTDPQMKEKIVIPSPLYSGTASFNLSILAAHKDFGWDFWTKFLANNPLLVKGNGSVVDTVAKKGRMCGLVLDFMALNAIKDGAGLKFFYFDEGAPIIREPIAILKGSKNRADALAFVMFILSKEGQEKLAALGYRPLRDDVKVPEIFNNIGTLKDIPSNATEILNRFETDRITFAKALA